MSRGEVRRRKTRSDKKRDIKPTIPVSLHDCVNRISYVTSMPMKDVGVKLCNQGIMSSEVIEEISRHFKRPYQFNSTLYMARNTPMSSLNNVIKKRITLRFRQDDHERIAVLAFALGLSVSSATGLLLEKSIKNPSIFKDFLQSTVDAKDIQENENKKRQLKEIFGYISIDNPYDSPISFYDILKFFYGGAKDFISNVVHYK